MRLLKLPRRGREVSRLHRFDEGTISLVTFMSVHSSTTTRYDIVLCRKRECRKHTNEWSYRSMADLISAFQKRTRDDMRRDQNAPESESPRPLRDQRVPGSRDYEQWRRQGRWHWFRKTTSSSGPSSPPLGVNTKKAVDQGQGLMHSDL